MKTIPLLAVTGLFTAGLMSSAFAYSGEKLAKDAKITLEQATTIAMKARPGKITDKELEKEKGGSGLRFTFDIKGKDSKAYEVGVDAVTGALLENGPDAD